MGVHAYGTSTIQDAGCGPTALAIVISALTGKDVTPQMTAAFAMGNLILTGMRIRCTITVLYNCVIRGF